MDARRLAYLEAMGIEVWQPRQQPLPAAPAQTSPQVSVGDGDGDILCLAHSEAESVSQLALDISRAMRAPPVWAWPSDQGGTMTLQAAAADRLLTRVLVFGEDLAKVLFGTAVPEVIAGARVHVVPGLEQLGREREAKRTLWGVMREHGIAAAPASGAKT